MTTPRPIRSEPTLSANKTVLETAVLRTGRKGAPAAEGEFVGTQVVVVSKMGLKRIAKDFVPHDLFQGWKFGYAKLLKHFQNIRIS